MGRSRASLWHAHERRAMASEGLWCQRLRQQVGSLVVRVCLVDREVPLVVLFTYEVLPDLEVASEA